MSLETSRKLSKNLAPTWIREIISNGIITCSAEMKTFRWTVPEPSLSAAEKRNHKKPAIAKRVNFEPSAEFQVDGIATLSEKEKKKVKALVSGRGNTIFVGIFFTLGGIFFIWTYWDSWAALREFSDIPYRERKDLSYSSMAYVTNFFMGCLWLTLGFLHFTRIRTIKIVSLLIKQIKAQQDASINADKPRE